MIDASVKLFKYYQSLGEKTFDQLPDKALFWSFGPHDNSIAVIVKHLHGNMLSRWTDFLESDGEKEWRDRDGEFEPTIQDRESLKQAWDEGWTCLLGALSALSEDDLNRIIYIRKMGHTVTEAIQRQLAHYAYHVGQIVYIGRMYAQGDWTSLSIPKNQSKQYNEAKFAKQRARKHFTEDL